MRPSDLQHTTSVDTTRAPTSRQRSARFTADANVGRFNAQLAYPAEVIRVIDGDTFEARVHVWPGLDVSTKVRLRNIDAPELHARCAEELAKAQAARAALETMLAAGGVTVSRVGIDKYGGRVDAVVATRDTAGRLHRAAQRWLGAQLRWRPPRKLVLIVRSRIDQVSGIRLLVSS